MRSRHCRPWAYSLGVVIGVPVEFALTAVDREFVAPGPSGQISRGEPGCRAVAVGVEGVRPVRTPGWRHRWRQARHRGGLKGPGVFLLLASSGV